MIAGDLWWMMVVSSVRATRFEEMLVLGLRDVITKVGTMTWYS